MDEKDFIALEEEFCARNYHPLPVVLSCAEGVWAWDINGNGYLDMLGCYSALNHGHRHPRILKAFIRQAKRLSTVSRAFYNDQLGLFSKELTEFCGMEMMLPMNTGAEAVETAIKAMRRWGYRIKKVEETKAEIIVCDNNFHGRTTTIVGFSSHENYRDGFGPFTPGFVSIPFNDTRALASVITPNTVGFLVEPIQGEGGIVIPDRGYLGKARRICDKNNILLALDEIQTGLGRTGKIFAFQHEKIKPDILILGKALGGGVYPASAVVGSREVLGLFDPGSHGSTFGGNPLACAVAREAIRVLIDERLVENSQKLGNYFLRRLRSLTKSSNVIKEVRGMGLMIGMEFNEGSIIAREFCKRLLKEGILAKETHNTVVRFTPPLIITKGQIDWALERIKRALN